MRKPVKQTKEINDIFKKNRRSRKTFGLIKNSMQLLRLYLTLKFPLKCKYDNIFKNCNSLQKGECNFVQEAFVAPSRPPPSIVA